MPSPQEYAPLTDRGDFHLILDGREPEQVSAEGLARQHAAMLAFGRRASSRPEIGVLMQDAMALVAEALETDLGGVSEVLADGQTLSLKIAGTDRHGKLVCPTTHSTPLSAEVSMAGYALNAACPVVTPNLPCEKRFTDLVLRRLGVVSALCVPLTLGENAFGALGAYAKRERRFTQDDIQFTETIGHLLTASMARVRLESDARQRQASSSSILELVDSLVLILDLEGNLLDMNRASQRVTGFSVEEIRGKPLWQMLVAPEEADLIRGLLDTSKAGIRPCEFESSLLTKQGTRRRAIWAVKLIPAESGQPASLLMVGTDRTQQLELEAELQKARETAERATEMMEELRTSVNKAADLATVLDPANVGQEIAVEQDPSVPVGPTGRELRASPRLAYHYYQFIAPLYTGNRMPPRKEFFPVECRDLSAGGISFLLDRCPDFEYLVVALGRPPAETFFTAHVVRVAKEEKDGKTRFIVGCRFAGRVSL
ncbi:MAG: PAS domain S-box protein [Thermoguttaceae bacterium]|jgi:PAS domain S-box-containing protein